MAEIAKNSDSLWERKVIFMNTNYLNCSIVLKKQIEENNKTEYATSKRIGIKQETKISSGLTDC